MHAVHDATWSWICPLSVLHRLLKSAISDNQRWPQYGSHQINVVGMEEVSIACIHGGFTRQVELATNLSALPLKYVSDQAMHQSTVQILCVVHRMCQSAIAGGENDLSRKTVHMQIKDPLFTGQHPPQHLTSALLSAIV